MMAFRFPSIEPGAHGAPPLPKSPGFGMDGFQVGLPDRSKSLDGPSPIDIVIFKTGAFTPSLFWPCGRLPIS